MAQPLLPLLRQARLFAGLSEEVVQVCAEAGRGRMLKGRCGRIAAEEMAERLFCVVSGEVSMVQVSPDGQECIIDRHGPGDFFCLASYVSGKPCPADCVSNGSAEVCYWPHDKFRTLVGADPVFVSNLLQQLAGQVARQHELRTLSRCCTADTKVVAYLLHKIKNGYCCRNCRAIVVDIKPISLTAQELGVARETLSRTLQRLACGGVISYQRGLVKVLDSERLETALEEDPLVCQGH